MNVRDEVKAGVENALSKLGLLDQSANHPVLKAALAAGIDTAEKLGEMLQHAKASKEAPAPYEWLGENIRNSGSKEYVKIRVTVTEAGAPRTASDFGPPQIAFASTRSAARTYRALEWESADTARLLIGPETEVELDAGTYYRFVRVEAGDEDEVQELTGVLVVR